MKPRKPIAWRKRLPKKRARSDLFLSALPHFAAEADALARRNNAYAAVQAGLISRSEALGRHEKSVPSAATVRLDWQPELSKVALEMIRRIRRAWQALFGSANF